MWSVPSAAKMCTPLNVRAGGNSLFSLEKTEGMAFSESFALCCTKADFVGPSPRISRNSLLISVSRQSFPSRTRDRMVFWTGSFLAREKSREGSFATSSGVRDCSSPRNFVLMVPAACAM